MSLPKWEDYAESTERLKVDGGHIYLILGLGACFVPDIDLSRYQSHLRDAYKQGYDVGYADCNNGDVKNND